MAVLRALGPYRRPRECPRPVRSVSLRATLRWAHARPLVLPRHHPWVCTLRLTSRAAAQLCERQRAVAAVSPVPLLRVRALASIVGPRATGPEVACWGERALLLVLASQGERAALLLLTGVLRNRML